ncbi:DNA-methyltransferase [Cyanobacterium aponinum]|uniref:Methyltransferase n=1 Tax=Cyanobacterium aponinum 0216 TaxID=2676140 RepID=A0A844GQY4_9CHRO|nr:site-specific DNA-methyltransferase [Cyanobacterium aponinum]MTF38954.1 site-specific DNA-methyltransferase [Cyanobacterium aponinum 0216]
MNKIILGNCLDELKNIDSEIVDLIYLDPPFFTQKKHSLITRDNSIYYEFNDVWNSINDYLLMMEKCLIECKRVLKKTGNIFLHCDKSASHHLRVLLDQIFLPENFRSEIIWSYKRWSNSKKGLLNSHQTIYFYSKTYDFKFNTIYTDYSPTTNVDQIWQLREKNDYGKSVYKKDKNGNIILAQEKKGVPLSDVWEIPFLNPKAKERVGYPTQKPVLLLQQIINISTDEGDLVLDAFCGSGTTCVAAKSLHRNFIGIDISEDAIALTQKRLNEMIITNSKLLEKGKTSYIEKSEDELFLLKSINAIPVQRNNGIDGFLKRQFNEKPIPVRIQKKDETLENAIASINNSEQAKKSDLKIVIQTNNYHQLFPLEDEKIIVIKSSELLIKEELQKVNMIVYNKSN